MKKILLSVVVALLCAGMVNAEKIYLSYTEGKNYTGAPMGIGTGDNMWIDMAIKIPGSTIKAMAGAKITGVNGSCTSIADIETVHAWLRTDLEGENLAEHELVPTQLNNLKKGINKLTFDTPWEIPADFEGDLYIGFGYKYVSGNARGLAASTTPIPGAFYLKRADGKWYDFSYKGSACIEAVVEGDNLPNVNVQLSRVDFPEHYVMSRGEYTSKLYIHNFGLNNLLSADIAVKMGNEEPITQRMAFDVLPGAMKTFAVTINPTIAQAGIADVEVTITPNDRQADVDMANNTQMGNVIVATHDYPRRVLSEEFTTELCGNCPEVTAMINESLELPEYKDVIMVCHHSGYKTDFLTNAWATTYLSLFGGGSYAPGLAADRAQREPDEIVFFPEQKEMFIDWWNERLATPAFVSVDIAVKSWNPETRELTVAVSGEKCLDSIAQNPSITVWVTQDNIAAQGQANGGTDYKHNHVCKYIQSDNHWGEPLTFENEQYSYECTFTLEEDYVLEDMHAVAFVSENGTGYKKRQVCNANSLSLSNLASVAHISMNKEVVSTEYYALTGQRIITPEEGVYICKLIYADGSSAAVKRIIRK